jgi:hypothetical protein
MDNDEPDAIAALLEFLYKLDYEVALPSDTAKDSREAQRYAMMLHLQVYAVSDRLQIQELKDLAESRFQRVAESIWSDSVFLEAIDRVYEITPPGSRGDGLRAIVLAISAKHTAKLGFKDCSADNMTDAVAGFRKDLAIVLAVQKKYSFEFGVEDLRCTYCSFRFKLKVPGGHSTLSCPLCAKKQSLVSECGPKQGRK